jgi:hypothetical protein
MELTVDQWWADFRKQRNCLQAALEAAHVLGSSFRRHPKSTWTFGARLAELCGEDELLDLVAKYPRSALQAYQDSGDSEMMFREGSGCVVRMFPTCDGKPFYPLAGVIHYALELDRDK